MTKTKRDRVLARRLKSVRILRSGMPGAPASNELHLSDRPSHIRVEMRLERDWYAWSLVRSPRHVLELPQLG